jgi:hypothetical protein
MPARFQFMHNFINHLFQRDEADRTLFKGLGQTAGELMPGKRLMRAVPLYYAQVRALDFFVGGKAIPAVEALATTPDTRAIPRLAGIDDLIVTGPALGTTHSVEHLNNTQLIVASMVLWGIFLFFALASCFSPPPSAISLILP